MKTRIYLIAILLLLGTVAYSQLQLPLQYRVEKQSMSYPMSELEEMFFSDSYYSKPITINFDGNHLHMFYDNNKTFVKKEVTEIDLAVDFDDDSQDIVRHYYTFNDSPTDTLMFVVDFDVPYVQLVLPTKDNTGNNVGYTSYKKYITNQEIALK